jgi:hypothetical protein
VSKFNTRGTTSACGSGPVIAKSMPTLVTYEGAPAYQRDIKSELFMLGVSNMVGENTFYESAGDRDARFAKLAGEVAVADVEWFARFTRWLRTEANMRSASLVAACEGVRARLSNGLRGSNRSLISGVCSRADEPGELLAYWLSTYGRVIPKPVKRGVADAAMRLYDEYSLLKYDTSTHALRFGDVIELTHPGDRKGSSQGLQWKNDTQRDLFKYAIDRRHNRDEIPETLRIVHANAALRRRIGACPDVALNTRILYEAGMTWEDALSLVGSKVDKAKLWEALIPTMGIFALARNLRNFDEAGVSDSSATYVMNRFTDPAQVAKSRMFPYRWYAACQAAPSLRWGHALDQALTAACVNVPKLSGRTLVLVDTSGSMSATSMTNRSKMTPVIAATVFGVALAFRGTNVDLVGFASGTFTHDIPRGGSFIREVDRFVKRVGEVGHGTMTAQSLRQRYDGHDRVIVITDEQAMRYIPSDIIPLNVPMYCFNLGGYTPAMTNWGASNRIELGGMTDATFKMIPLIESGRNADWPF